MNINTIKQQLNGIETSHLCDASPHVSVLKPEYTSVGDISQLIGFAYTVDCNGGFTSTLEAIDHIQPGEVLVLQSGQCEQAVIGGFFTHALKKNGAAGMIVDGFCRDHANILKADFPSLTRGFMPQVSSNSAYGKQQVPIHCFGVNIHPGDLIVADSDGVVVIPKAEIEATIAKARLVQQKEACVQGKVDQGFALRDLMNTDEHLTKLKKGEHSELRFTIDEQ